MQGDGSRQCGRENKKTSDRRSSPLQPVRTCSCHPRNMRRSGTTRIPCEGTIMPENSHPDASPGKGGQSTTRWKIERLCMEYDKPFTLADLRDKFVDRYRHVPTYQELAWHVPKLPFVQRVVEANNYHGAVYEVRS